MHKTAKRSIKPKVSIIGVKPVEVTTYWPLAQFLIREALNYSGKYAEPKHFYELLLTDQMQLWIMFGNDEAAQNKMFGICITRIVDMPNYPQLEIIICTGSRRDLWEDRLIAEVTDFAKHNKCKRLSIMARPGWERISKKWGWKKRHVQLEKWI